jgi:ABC-type Zn uptake system ZnuABC Zn-binding protein ZnuA
MRRPPTLIVLGLLASGPAHALEPLEVVTTLPAYAAIAQSLGGERVHARAISRGDEDAHFVKPKPSFALMLREADLFVTTGLDLELWAPALVDKSGNRTIRQGQPGYVSASEGLAMLDVPQSTSRAEGDIHIFGNPHVHTSPLNAKRIAANITAGLKRIDPAAADFYEERLRAFQQRIDESLFGAELVELLGGETLDALSRQGKLIPFLESQHYEDTPLIDRLGGWLRAALAFRGREIVAYHKNWIYLADLLGLQVLDYVERKPGIPPSARHVHQLVEKIRERQVDVLLAANYYSSRQIEAISERTGCRAAVVPLGPMQIDEGGYFRLVDGWISSLATAFAG